MAEWIWAVETRRVDQTAHLHKRFHLNQPVQQAELRVVSDFARAITVLNGQRIVRLEHDSPAVTLDVTHGLQRGENILELNCTSTDGPAAVAVTLTLHLQDDSRRRIVSDGTWLASLRPDDGRQKTFPKEEWQRCVSFGKLAPEPWGDSQASVEISEFDDYTQWKQAQGSSGENDPSTFLVSDGFEIERLRSAGKDEGSWVSLAFDPQGRLTIAREDRGLLRLTLSRDTRRVVRVETINDTLLECRGLLYAHGSLYANANNSKGLYRLRDTNGDDRFDDVHLLYESPGSVGHGRNDLVLGPDGLIYDIHGDAVDLPRGISDATSPFRAHRRGRATREGHVLRTDPSGKNRQVIAAGLRNPYGIDFNSDGEMFTYDADAEHDMGAPWYRPTRVVHLVSGADYGWRGVTGAWPPYNPDHPDNGQPILDIGKGSPTGVKFGTKSNFPLKYQGALFVLDWAYGRIIAVHMTPRGSSYACRAETFVKGRPLNVTDLGFGPDGAMYVVTGGRKTQSALYRIRYVGPAICGPCPTQQQAARVEYGAQSRAVRRRLERLHGRGDPRTVDTAWPFLAHPDLAIRHAARIAVEHQPLEQWQARALTEERPSAMVTALTALARGGGKPLMPRILQRLNRLDITSLPAGEQLAVLYVYQLCLDALPEPEPQLAAAMVARLTKRFPDETIPVELASRLRRRLCSLLVRLQAPQAVEKTLSWLASAERQEDRLHGLFVLRDVKHGWTPAGRRDYFQELRRSRRYVGGAGLPGFLTQIRKAAVATLNEQERMELGPLLKEQPVASASPPARATRPFVKEWKTADLLDSLSQVSRGRNFRRGESLFREALCARCHRMGNAGEVLGPNLTSVARRFSRRDILESILAPSKVIAPKYRGVQVLTTDGKTIVGRIAPGGDFRSPTLRIVTDPLQPDKIVEIPKQKIESHRHSAVSTMPGRLLDTLTKTDVLNLLAYIESAGDSNHPSFKK